MSNVGIEFFRNGPSSSAGRALDWRRPVRTCLAGAQLLSLILFCAGQSVVGDVVLDDTWTLSVAGQTVKVNPDGSFVISNISAPDKFGPGGPGTRPDFLSDDFLRLVGFSTAGGITRYVFSDPFQIRQGQAFVVTNLTFTLTPPPFPESLLAVSDQPTLTVVGQTTQVHVTANLIDGSTMDVTPRTAWTVYRTSNPDIATVNGDGVVTAVSKGKAFITAVNASATAVTEVDVSLGDPLTTIKGIALDRDGAPVAGVTITVIGLAGSAVTGPDGSFSIPGVATTSEIQGVMARRASGGVLYLGLASKLKPVPGGLTDGGIIRVVSCIQLGIDCVDTDGDGLPDSVERALGLDPTKPDTNGNGVLDGNEDYDGDGLSNLAEIILGTDPKRADTDGDGLSDGAEVYQYGTNPLKVDTDMDGLSDGDEIKRGTNPLLADSDGDGWNDESELTAGSDPLDPNSKPRLLLVGAPVLRIGLPQFSLAGGAGVTVGQPGLSIGLIRFEGGLKGGVTVAQPPFSIGLVVAESGLRGGLTVAQPLVRIGVPVFGGGPGTGVTVGQPPLKLKIATQ